MTSWDDIVWPDDPTYVDTSKDNIKTVMEKLKRRAYGSSAPEGGYDVPASHMVLHTTEEFADYEVSFDYKDEWDEPGYSNPLSECPRKFPPINTPEMTPKASDEPFECENWKFLPKGFFSNAIIAYGKMVGLIKALNENHESFDRWFKWQWGIEADFDLSPYHATTRSTGDALWAGIKRKVVPFVFAMPAAQTLIKIKQIRDRFSGVSWKPGTKPLIDFPRVKAVINAIALQVLTMSNNSNLRYSQLKMYFRINDAVYPNAPTKRHIFEFEIGETKVNNINMLILRQYAEQIKKIQMARLAAENRLIFQNNEQATLVPMLVEAVKSAPEYTLTTVTTEDEVVDIMYDPNIHSKPQTVVFEEKPIEKLERNPGRILFWYAFHYRLQNKDVPINSYELFKVLTTSEGGDEAAKARVMDLVKMMVPDSFLKTLSQMGNSIKANYGNTLVKKFMFEVDASRNAYSKFAIIDQMKVLKNEYKSAIALLQIFCKGMNFAEKKQKSNPYILKKWFKAMFRNEDMRLNIAEVTKMHLDYWATSFELKKDMSKRLTVVTKTAAKVYKKVKIKVIDKLEVDENSFYEIMIKSAEKFVKKRMNWLYTENMFVEVPRNLAGMSSIDAFLLENKPPDINPYFSELAFEIYNKLLLSLEDLNKFFCSFWEDTEDYFQNFNDIITHAKKQKKKPPGMAVEFFPKELPKIILTESLPKETPVAAPPISLGFSQSDDDYLEMKQKKPATFDTYSYLADKYIAITRGILEKAIAKFGKMCMVRKRNELHEFVENEMASLFKSV